MQRLLESGEASVEGIFALYIDLQKAFDQVPRRQLWKVLFRRGLPIEFVRLLRNIHKGTQCQVRSEGLLGPLFDVSQGVRQGSKEGPMLFNLFIDSIMREALNRMNKAGYTGISFAYRFDGQWVDALTADQELLIQCLLYADDIILLATSEDTLQGMYDILEEELCKAGLSISPTKTEAQRFLRGRGTEPKQPLLPQVFPYFEVTPFPETVAFKYLGQRKERHCSVQAELTARISSAIHAFSSLRRSIFCNRAISRFIRFRLFRCMVVSL